MMKYIVRVVEQEMESLLGRKEVIALVGPRQVGKTTLLLNLQKKLKQRGEKVKYMTFENRAELDLFEKSIDDFKKLHEGYKILMIDEFHYAREGGQKLKYLYDTTPTKFIISGSSSLELTFQTGRYMVGRLLKLHLWPFSFREYLSAKDQDLAHLMESEIGNIFVHQSHKSLSDAVNQRLEKHFHEYIRFGAYPAPILEENLEIKQKLLESIFNNYLLKDIKGLLSLATSDELVTLARFLALQIGNLINYQELSNISRLSLPQVKKHFEILEETYIIKLVQPFFTNKRTELVKRPKVYFLDTGFRNLLINNFNHIDMRQDAGSLVENFVFLRLFLARVPFSSVKFWRTKSDAEVDFVLQKEAEFIPIEVKYSTRPSVGKSLYSFIDKFAPPTAFVLTRGYAETRKIGKTTLIFAPVYYL